MQFSYWEYKTWLSGIDFTIVGSGIVGLSTAIFLKERYPKAKILILEKGILPQGASTKNAGFACYGSLSEILADLENHTEEEVVELVKQRFKGIHLLRHLLGDEKIGYQQLGGHELFLDSQKGLFEKCQRSIEEINALLNPVFDEAPFLYNQNKFGFEGIYSQYITHKFEGQLNTGLMMKSLLQLALKKNIQILNAIEVLGFDDSLKGVTVRTGKFEFFSRKLLIATNGFAQQLITDDLIPARAQVLITKPIKNLHIEGTFHFDEGYYYFRNIDNRILFGGGRNLDFEGETSTELKTTETIQNELEKILSEMILPNKSFEIDKRWSGIMGVGHQKKPIIKSISDNVFCGVRLGGMGVAIGSLVGKELSELV